MRRRWLKENLQKTNQPSEDFLILCLTSSRGFGFRLFALPLTKFWNNSTVYVDARRFLYFSGNVYRRGQAFCVGILILSVSKHEKQLIWLNSCLREFWSRTCSVSIHDLLIFSRIVKRKKQIIVGFGLFLGHFEQIENSKNKLTSELCNTTLFPPQSILYF